MARRARDHAFSIELQSRRHLRSVQLGEARQPEVFIEGVLGELRELRLVEDSMLEVRGIHGSLLLDVSGKEFRTHTHNQARRKSVVTLA